MLHFFFNEGFPKSFKNEWFFDKEMYTQRQNIFQELKPLTKANNDHFEQLQIDASYQDIVKELRKDAVVRCLPSKVYQHSMCFCLDCWPRNKKVVHFTQA